MGLTRNDDLLPKRFLSEPLPEGKSRGSLITPEEMDTMLDEYYSLRGWTKEGVPKENEPHQ